VKEIGVILCGSGFLDGSEIREAVATLWALSRHPVKVQVYAPEGGQPDVVDHLTGKPVAGESRDMLVESARIARGQVKSLSQADPSSLAAVILPGGYGAAKSLCNFASRGHQGVVCAEVARLLVPMHEAGKPIGALCIAPALVGLAFKGEGFRLTLGPGGEAAEELEKAGHVHVPCLADGIVVDERARIVSTPAYMIDEAPLHEIFTGIGKLVDRVVALS
jgi:enhancing lycopene biosynthesis protein 2